MKLLKQTTPTCLVYSAAMAMGIPVSSVTTFLGRDGSEPRPNGAPVGVHMQEIQDLALSVDHHFYLVLPSPVQKYRDGGQRTVFQNQGRRFFNHVQGRRGILIGRYPQGEDHAVAFEGLEIYDPNGMKYMMSEGKYLIEEAWIYV